MASTDYTISPNNGAGSDIVWEFWKYIVYWAHNDPVSPWITRGSSAVGEAGAFASNTPDGIDYWSDKTRLEAGSGTVWHVLENVDTGIQVCLSVLPFGGSSTAEVVLAINKFEASGVWRGGGSSTAVRPTDVTSSPAAARELATNTAAKPTPQTNGMAITVAIRKDGRGFYAYMYDPLASFTSVSSYMCGVAPLNDPDDNDQNPNVAMAVHGSGMDDAMKSLSGSNLSIIGRMPDGTVKEHVAMFFTLNNGATFLDTTNPWRSAKPIAGVMIGITSPATGSLRSWVPDIFIGSTQAADSQFKTWKNKELLQANFPTSGNAFLLPWPGATQGADTPAYILPEIGAGGPVTPGVVDPKRFNQGMDPL